MGYELFSISRLFFCGADIYMLNRFFSALFETRWKGKKRILASAVIIIMIYLINSFGSMLLNFVMVSLFCYLYAITLFKISLTNGLVYIIIYYATFAGGKEVSFELLYRLLSNISPYYIAPWFESGGIYFLLVEYIAGFLFLLFIEKFIKKINISNNNNFSWYLLILPVVSLMITSSFLYMDFPDSIIMQIFICGGAFLLFFANAAIFIILERYTAVLDKVKYAELSTVKREMENEHFQNILKINDHYQCFMHDINSYFSSFRILALSGESKKIVEIIDELKGKIREETIDVLYNGNPVLNAILLERVSRAKEKEIELNLFIEKFLKIDFVSDADLISMIGNLLDNALEATERCSRENRKVDVKLFMGTNYFLILHIENSFVVSAKRNGTQLISTKEDSSHHGLGIGIVMALAEKYGGTLHLEEKDEVFVTTLTLSAYRE